MKNKKLNIVFLDFDDVKNPLLGAGQARATVEVGSRLVKMGNRLTVICSRYPGYKDRTENGIYYKHIGFGTHNIRLNNLLYILLLPFTVMRLKGDIVVECFTAPVSTLFSPLFTKIPVVALPTSFEAERFTKLYHLPFDKVERFGLRFYKYLMPYTKSSEERIKEINKKAVTRVIPEGVGSEFFKIKPNMPKHILFLGRFDMGQKGIDLLLKAYEKVSDKVGYPLVMAGFGPDEEKIKKMVNSLKLQNKVKFVGGAFGDKKKKLLADSLYVAFSSRHEGFSLFSLEALASGLPLVGFDIPGLSWTDDRISLKAKMFDINEYSKYLVKATDKHLIKQMRKDSRIFATKYTWENVANKFEEFFYFVLKNESQNLKN